MSDIDDALATVDIETEIQRVDTAAVAVLARSEVEAQLDAAHKHPRSIKRFLAEAKSLATLTEEIAQSCIYTLPRADKAITGPSVRMAEIVASAYGNLHVGARVLGDDDSFVTSQGVAWDLEKNLRVTIETRRRITDKKGKRFKEDMIAVTGNAAASISFRNAIFRVVPRAYVDAIYAYVRKAAVGDVQTLSDRRGKVMAALGKMGITPDRILARVGKPSVEDLGLDELELLIGLGTAIKQGETSPDDAFPPVRPAADADVVSLEDKIKAEAKAKDTAKETAAAAPAAEPKPEPAKETKKAKDKPQSEAGPAAPAPPLPTCMTCNKPIDGPAVSTFNKEGEPGQRHPACKPASEA